MKVAGHEVKNVTRDSAEIGCTKVTKAEAEAVLEAMKNAHIPDDFKITNEFSTTGKYVNFRITNPQTGWISVSREEKGYPSDGFVNKSASLCFSKEHAEKLLRFLAEQLGYGLTRPMTPGVTGTADRYKIEYRYAKGNWQRSGNRDSSGIYTYDEAIRRAAEQQRIMGSSHEYRAVPAGPNDF